MKAPRITLVSLKVAIIVPLVILFGATILIQSLTHYQTVRRMVDEGHAARLEEATRALQTALGHFLAPAMIAQRALADTIVRRDGNAHVNPAGLTEELEHLFSAVRTGAPQIGTIGFGSMDGVYVGMRASGADEPVLVLSDPGLGQALPERDAGAGSANVAGPSVQRDDVLDKGWFIAGAAHRTSRWTVETRNADRADTVAISYSGAILRDGVVTGVATSGIAFEALDAFVDTLSEDLGVMIAIVDDDDRLIARSQTSGAIAGSGAAPGRGGPALLGSTADVLAHGIPRSTGRFSFTAGAETYRAHLEHYAPSPALHLRLVALLPESPALGHLRSAQLLGLVTPFALGLSVLLGGLWLIGELTRPIADTIDRMANLAPGEPTRPTEGPRLPVREAVMLSAAMSTLSQRLNNAFERMREAVMLDTDTGLPTLQGLRDKVSWTHPRPCLLVIIGIDSQATIDALLGTPTGDQLAVAIAERLRARAPDASIIARIDRASFAVLHDAEAAADHYPSAEERLMDTFDAPFELARDTLVVRISMASVTGPLDASLLDDWMERARATIDLARANGGGTHLHAGDEIGTASRMRQQLCEELAGADLARALVTHYQPIISLATGEVVAIEALTRWQHPKLGLLGPESFISASETSALALEIGRHMLARGCRDAMHHFRATGQHLEVHINLSARQILQSNFLDLVLNTLHEHHLPPSQLVLELRESLLDGAMQAGIDELMRSLHAIGVRTAIDEFGRGPTAIGRLAELPLDYVKLDRRLVRELSRGVSRTSALVPLIIGFAHKLGLECIAVGVESRVELGLLHRMGCERAQGFLFGDPCPFHELSFQPADHLRGQLGEGPAPHEQNAVRPGTPPPA